MTNAPESLQIKDIIQGEKTDEIKMLLGLRSKESVLDELEKQNKEKGKEDKFYKLFKMNEENERLAKTMKRVYAKRNQSAQKKKDPQTKITQKSALIR